MAPTRLWPRRATLIGSSGYSTPPVTFTIIIGAPAAPGNFGLAPGSDTGIVGDNITSDRTPEFIGTTVAGRDGRVVRGGQFDDLPDGHRRQRRRLHDPVPFVLTNGTISLYVEAVDQAGNQSTASNTLTVSIVSIASDYNADSYSDAALYDRGTVTFTGTLTSGSAAGHEPEQLDRSGRRCAASRDRRIPSGTTISAVNTTSFTGTLLTGSALVTGISSTSGLFAGENVTGTGIPAGATILSDQQFDRRHPVSQCDGDRRQSLTATAITLSANATVSGVKTLTASPGLWLVATDNRSVR